MAKSTRMTFCSFCGKAQNEVKKMIAGPAGVHICDGCVTICKTIIDRELMEADDQPATEVQTESKALASLLSPAQIVAGLDEHIVSQDYAKRALAVAVYNHYKRLHVEASSEADAIDQKYREVQIEKSNILLLGTDR